MNRKFNIKLGLLLGGGLILSAGALHSIHELQTRRHADAWLAQARQGGTPERGAQALNYYYVYLTLQPDDSDVLLEYALLQDSHAKSPKDRRQAIGLFERGLAKQPERHDVREKLVKSALGLGDFSNARRHLQILLQTFPDSPSYQGMLGQCLEAEGEHEQAAAYYEQAIDHDPQAIDTYRRLAGLLRRRLEDPARARDILDRMIAANGASGRAYLVRARHRQAEGDWPGAEQDLEQASTLDPADPEALLLLAKSAPATGRRERLRPRLEEALASHPRHAGLRRALAALEWQAGRGELAEACLRQGLQLTPHEPDLLQFQCELLLQRGALAEARLLARKLRSIGCAPAVVGYWDARLQMAEGRWAEAARTLEAARSTLGGSEWGFRVQLALGQCYREQGDLDRHLTALQQAVAASTGATLARLALADALLEADRNVEALAELRGLNQLPQPRPEAKLSLARALLARNLQLPPGRRDWQELETVLAEVEPQHDPIRVLLVQGEVLAAQERWQEAQTLLEGARDRHPEAAAVWTALAALLERRGQTRSALRVLDDALRRLDRPIDLQLARLRILSRLGGRVGAEASAIERSLDQRPAAEQSRIRLALAEACCHSREFTVAQRLAAAAAAGQPTDLRSRLLLLELALQTGRHADYERVLAEVRHIEGNEGTHWRAAETARLLRLAQAGDRAGLPAARAHLAEIGKRRPGWARLYSLRGELDDCERKSDQAIESYQRALELGERRPEVCGRLARLLHARRRPAEANQVIQLMEERGALHGPDVMLAAEVALAGGAHQRAAAFARQAAASAGADFQAQLWLARLLHAAGQPQDAEKALRAAAARWKTVPEVWSALVRHLVHVGERAQAEALIRELKPEASGQQANLIQAGCYEALGQADRARELFAVVLKEQPDDPETQARVAGYFLRTNQPAAALPLLRLLRQAKPTLPEPLASWVRRELAVALASGSEEQFREALALVDPQRAEGGDAEERQARIRILARRPEHRAEAIRLQEAAAQQNPISSEDKYLLARLYRAAGEQRKAREQLAELVNVPALDPLHLADYIANLLDDKETKEAQFWFAKLERLEPDAARTQALKSALSRLQE
jgi:predicted Zn-dependent protease